MMPALSISDLNVSLLSGKSEPRSLVQSMSLVLNPGEIGGLAGESGSGKSLTALALMRLLPVARFRVNAASMCINGVETVGLSMDAVRSLRGHAASMIFQEPMSSLNPSMRIIDLIKEALRRRPDIDPRSTYSAAVDILRQVRFDDPERVLDAFPHQLSGGMRQRIMIAMAFCNSPRLLIADEPTTALDVSIQREILMLLRELACDKGCAVLLISHDLAVISAICDSVSVMRDGRLIQSGPVAKTLANPSEAYTRLLLSSFPDQGEPRERLPIDDPSASVLLSPPNTHDRRLALMTAAKVAEAQDVTVCFGASRGLFRSGSHFTALDGVSLSVSKGETLSIIGESGSGKTTLARALAGLQSPTSGRIRVLEQSPGEAARSGKLQIIFQDPRTSLSPRLPVWRIVTEPLFVRGERRGLRARAAELLARTGLGKDTLDRGPEEFSGGQRQRIAIARALSTDPELLILDEPTSALDVSVQARILNLLLDLQDQNDLTYVLVTHDIAVVAHLSDRIMVMKAGRIIETGATSEVLQHPSHPYTQSLIAARPRLPQTAWRPQRSLRHVTDP